MSSTDKRQITELVKGILKKYDIDNLTVEMVLIDSFWRYVVERKQGRDIAQVRIDILESIKDGNEKESSRDAMETRIKSAMGIDPRTTPHLWDGVIRFLVEADKRAETIERFANACEADPYNMPKTHQIAQKPILIQTMWAKVFRGGIEVAKADNDGGFR